MVANTRSNGVAFLAMNPVDHPMGGGCFGLIGHTDTGKTNTAEMIEQVRTGPVPYENPSGSAYMPHQKNFKKSMQPVDLQGYSLIA